GTIASSRRHEPMLGTRQRVRYGRMEPAPDLGSCRGSDPLEIAPLVRRASPGAYEPPAAVVAASRLQSSAWSVFLPRPAAAGGRPAVRIRSARKDDRARLIHETNASATRAGARTANGPPTRRRRPTGSVSRIPALVTHRRAVAARRYSLPCVSSGR